MRKTISFFLAVILAFSLIPAAFAASDDALDAADALHALGLFNGIGENADGTPIYDLDRAPTRNEAVTMLVRLLGKEAEAKAGTWETPFTDLDDWVKPYVGYAYTNKLTYGTSATTFGGSELVSATQYLTFVLRALGYDSSKDFAWNEAWKLSDELGITHGEFNEDNNYDFIRGDVAEISVNALPASMNGSESTLAETLIAEGVFTEEQYMEVTDASEEPAEEEVRAVGSIAELMLGGRMILTRDLYMTNDVTLTNDFELDLNGFTIFGDTNTTQALNGDGIVITQTRCLELTVAHGVTAKLYNGNIKNAMFRNYGTITELSGLNTETQAGPGISNGGYISLIQRCMITGETIGLQNSGDIDLIDNCDITGHTYAAVTCVNGVSEWAATGKNRIAKITHSRMTGTNWERGIGFSGGNSMNAETLIEDCILVGYGWGGIQAYGYPITVRDSVIINASFGEFRAAVWYWDTGVTAPTMQNCVLIAEDGPCGYYLSGYVDLPFSGNGTCDFYQLSQVTDLSYYTYWQMQ